MPAADKPRFWDEASSHLMQRDRILKRLIPRHRAEWLSAPATPFVTLARAIVGQQISLKSAQAMWQKLVVACDGQEPTPERVQTLAQTDAALAGLSKRKAEYVLGLADHFIEDKIQPAAWHAMDDEAVIADLCSVRGIGRWTAEMFLIFNLQRPDVLPLDDASLLKAISLHYFSGEPVSRFEAREVAQAWAPWRTVAAWYLWR
ncbi:MAG: DNA-3-methyladenine glycosylase 2 family protein, partial [Burkholderiaceae bacterium]|nr:DNA-3-methyladenine glycosylase 2 family protein [Burkholderiaceae bacterium]